MSSSDEPVSGGGGRDGLGRLVERYIGLSRTDDGTPIIRFQLFRLLAALAGGFILAVWTGLISLIDGVAGAVELVLTGTTEYLTDLVGTYLGGTRAIPSGAIEGAIAQVSGAGIGGFLLAIIGVGFGAYLVAITVRTVVSVLE